ncbi:hypothetical protein Tco_0633391 [Tanacetum coccineum]
MKGLFARDFVPLLPTMLAGAVMDLGEGSAQPVEPHHTPVDPIPSTSQPPIPLPLHSPPHSPPHSTLQSLPHSPHQSPPFSPPHYLPPRSYEAPLPEGNTSGSAEASMELKELMDIVPKLVTRIVTLETELQQTRTTYGKAGDEPEDQGRIIQDIDDDPLVSLGVSKVKSTDKGKRYRRRARSVAKYINTRLDAEEEINTSREEINIEEAGLEEAIKLQAQMDEEMVKQIHLDEMIAKRMAEEEALSEQQKKRKAQLKKLSFEEIKEEFDKLVQQIDTFVPMDFEATKAKLKRYGEELQTKTSKKQKIDDKDIPAIGEKVAEVKKEETVKRTGKRKKQKARKGIRVDKNAQGDSKTDKEELVEAMNPTPLATKSNIKYGINRPEDAYDRVLWSDLRTMFDPPLNEDAIWSLPLQ